MDNKENALRIIRFDRPERVVPAPPLFEVRYRGADHEGYEGGGDDSPPGARWVDIWGTGWRKELDGVMGFPCGNPLASVEALKRYPWPDPDDERICGPDQSLSFPQAHWDALLGAVDRFGRYPLEALHDVEGKEVEKSP